MAHWPPFFFRAQEMQPARNVPRSPDRYGRWHPPQRRGENRLNERSRNHGQFWACNGQVVRPMPPEAVPAGARHFRTVSVYHFDDEFDVVEYDATRFPVGDAATSGFREGWHRMRFTHRPNTSSFASNFGDQNRLCRQHANQAWAMSLLPRGCWAPNVEQWAGVPVGGMNGHLPLLIALIILSFPAGTERQVLEGRFRDGRWVLNANPQPCLDYRGIVVETWTWPSQSDHERLQAFENGQFGNIFS